jgi:hypothetical protein
VSCGSAGTSTRAVFFARTSASTRRVRHSRTRAFLAARDAPRSVRFSAIEPPDLRRDDGEGRLGAAVGGKELTVA